MNESSGAELHLFSFSGQQVRVVTRADGETCFVAADVAAVLGYSGGARNAISRLPERMKGVAPVNTPGGQQQMVVLLESGVNRLIMRAETELAERVQDWLAEEVLPAISRTGGYAIPQQLDPASIDRRALALMVIEAEDARAVAERQVAELEPKARMAETVMSADGDWSVREAAQVLNRDPAISTGQRRLFGTLRELKWVDARGIPYQAQIENGRLSTRVRVYDHPHTGEPTLADPQVRITGKGLAALHRHLDGQRPVGELVDVVTSSQGGRIDG